MYSKCWSIQLDDFSIDYKSMTLSIQKDLRNTIDFNYGESFDLK